MPYALWHTVFPPTMTASDRARASNTSCLEAGEDTHAECPEEVAIFPSAVMAYFRTENGRPVTALCSSACIPTNTPSFSPPSNSLCRLGSPAASTTLSHLHCSLCDTTML